MRISERLFVVNSENFGFFSLFFLGFHVELLVSFVKQLSQLDAFGLNRGTFIALLHDQLDRLCP